MACNPRDNAVQGQEVALQIQFYDSCGEKVVADEMPTITITDLDGNILVDATSEDVESLGDGLYQYKYRVPEDGDAGFWSDEWNAVIDEATFTSEFIFTVVTPTIGLSSDSGKGIMEISDDVIFDFSQEEILGVNTLLKY